MGTSCVQDSCNFTYLIASRTCSGHYTLLASHVLVTMLCLFHVLCPLEVRIQSVLFVFQMLRVLLVIVVARIFAFK